MKKESACKLGIPLLAVFACKGISIVASSLLVAVLKTLCNFCENSSQFSSFIYVAFTSMLSGECHNATTVKSSTL